MANRPVIAADENARVKIPGKAHDLSRKVRGGTEVFDESRVGENEVIVLYGVK